MRKEAMTKEEIKNDTMKRFNNYRDLAQVDKMLDAAMTEYADQQCLERDERIKKLEEALKMIRMYTQEVICEGGACIMDEEIDKIAQRVLKP